MDRGLAHAVIGQILDDLGDAARRRRAREIGRMDHLARVDVSLGQPVGRERRLGVLGLNDDLDREAVLLREFKIALVVRRDGHHRPGAVLHQGIVGHPQRHLLAADRVRDKAAGEDALFLGGLGRTVHGTLPADALDKVHHGLLVLGAANQVGHERMLRREAHERDAPERVGPRGEARQRLAGVGEFEIDPRAFTAADPVGLHGADRLGPPVQELQILQQPLGIVGDLEEPLLEVALLDCRAAPFATAGNDFLVGQGGRAGRAPVDRRFLLVGQSALVQHGKDPLRPLVVVGVAGGHLARPVVADAPPLELRLHGGNVLARPLGGVGAHFDGGVLGRQPEGVPAHGRQDIVALGHLVAGHDVADDVVATVADVEGAARVREHHEAVKLLARIARRVRRDEGTLLRPRVLPLGLDGLGDILCHGSSPCVPPGIVRRRQRRQQNGPLTRVRRAGFAQRYSVTARRFQPG